MVLDLTTDNLPCTLYSTGTHISYGDDTTGLPTDFPKDFYLELKWRKKTRQQILPPLFEIWH